MQRENENALQVQDNLEQKVTGGVSSFSMIRTVLSFFAVAYDLMRRLSVDDIKFLGQSENGRVLLRFAQTIQRMIGDDGLYLWRDVEGLGEENVPAETLDKIRREAREEVLGNLTWDELGDDLKDDLTEKLRMEIRQELVDEATSAACDAVYSSLRYRDGFDPDSLETELGFAETAVETISTNFGALKELVEREFDVLEEKIGEAAVRVEDAKNEIPSDGFDFDDIAQDVSYDVETAIEGI